MNKKKLEPNMVFLITKPGISGSRISLRGSRKPILWINKNKNKNK